MNILDLFVLFTGCLAEVYICHRFFSAFFKAKNNFEGWIAQSFAILIATLVAFGINLIGNSELNLISIPLVYFAYCYVIFSGKLIWKVLTSILSFIVIVGCEFLFVVILEFNSTDSTLHLSEVPVETFIIKLLSFIILTAISQLHTRKDNLPTHRLFWSYLLVPISSLLLMFGTYFATQSTVQTTAIKTILIIGYAIVLFSSIIIFVLFEHYANQLNKTFEQDLIIRKQDMDIKYYTKVVEIDDNRKKLVHDLKHYTTALNALAVSGEPAEIVNLINGLNNKLDENELNIFSKIPFLDVILRNTKSNAEKEGINTKVYVEPSVTFAGISKSDYIVMFENLIDNAIRAASQCTENPRIDINVFTENCGSFLVTKIKNTFVKNSILKSGDDFLTTKKDTSLHGIGIKSVKNMASNSGGIFTAQADDTEFTAILVLPITQSSAKE